MRTTPPTLEDLTAPVIDRLAVDAVLVAEELPILPPTLAAESIMATKSCMNYGGGFGLSLDRDEGSSYRADVVNFHSSRRGYRALAAALVCVLLHRSETDTDVRFVDPDTHIKTLHIQRAHCACAGAIYRALERSPSAPRFYPEDAYAGALGLTLRPISFAPRLDGPTAQEALAELDDGQQPRFLLAHKNQATDVREPWDARDHVRLATSDAGLTLLTSGLIDYALHGTPERELVFRGPPFGELGSYSANVRFWLPGGIGYGV